MATEKDLNPTRYKIKVSYDGTNYSGWQVQPQHRSVQGEIEKLLRAMTCQERVRLESSGRTDTGVHAREQVAHFNLDKQVKDVRYLQRGLNAQLDRDIRILKIEQASPTFHARFDPVGKEYRYFIYNGPILPPHKRFYRLHEVRPLNLEKMQAAANLLVGEHDFAPFAVNPKRKLHCTVRTLYSFDVHKHGSEITLAVKGSGFLYKMVRSLAGFLLQVGRGYFEPEEALVILDAGIRTAKVPTAQPQGLFLWKVYYGVNLWGIKKDPDNSRPFT